MIELNPKSYNPTEAQVWDMAFYSALASVLISYQRGGCSKAELVKEAVEIANLAVEEREKRWAQSK